jgi:glutathione S-transferase
MITLYHAPKTRSVRIHWLLEELGDVAYELNTIKFKPEVIKGPEYRQIHPLGKVPAMQDDGVVMFESGAMVQYILEKYGAGRLEPQVGTPERAKFLQWIHFAEATATAPLGDIAQHSFFRPEAERIPAMVDDGRRRYTAALDVLESELAGRQYLLGDEFSAADVMMGYALMLGKLLGVLTDAHPNVQAYLGRLEQRPAYQKAVG